MQVLCNSDNQQLIRISAVTEDGSECNRVTMKAYELELQSEFRGAQGGAVIFTTKTLVEVPTFVDYLRSGWRIAFTCAIDYTASNGPHHDPRSLHFIGPYPNQYEQAIKNVGQVLEPYDADGGFSVYGFGGIPRHIG